MKIFVIGFISILIITFNLYGQGIPYWQEFQVNTFSTGYQDTPSVQALSNGDFVVCWQSEGQDSSEYAVVGQLFEASGIKYGKEFIVNTYTQGFQGVPTIAALSNGGFVVCWSSQDQNDSHNGIYGQLFDASGVRKGDEFLVCKDGRQASVAALSTGGFVVCWPSYNSNSFANGLYGQIFNEAGLKKGAAFQVNLDNDLGYQSDPVVAALSDARFVVSWVWYWYNTNNRHDIFCQLYKASGNKEGDKFQVNSDTQLELSTPTTAELLDGSFVVLWEATTQNFSQDHYVYGQMFDVSGKKKGSEFVINSSLYAQRDLFYPTVSALPNGGFVFCGTDEYWIYPFYRNCISGQLYNASGTKNGNRFLVNSRFNYLHFNPKVALLSDEKFVVCWVSVGQDGSQYGIFGKIFPTEPIVHQLQEFSLIEPANDATLEDPNITFRWQQPSQIRKCYSYEISYDLFIDRDFNFSNAEIVSGIEDTTITINYYSGENQTYFWKVLAKNLAGDSLWSTQQDWGFFIKRGATLVENADNEIPKNFELFQNYPNPFNSSTEIRYSLPNRKASYQVQLKVYDILGRLVKVLVNQEQSAGSYAISWDGTDLGGNRVASGVYLYSLEAGSLKSIRKMLVLQ